ncbi:hypothetical protein [Stenotrophomonas sp. P5_B8]
MPVHTKTLLMCALLTSISIDIAVAEQPDPNIEHVNGILDVIDGATRDGMVVVLTPVPYPQSYDEMWGTSLVPGFLLADSFHKLPPLSARTFWQNEQSPSQHYMPGFSANTLERKPMVYLWTGFEVHVIAPGTYRLTSAESYRIDATLANLPKPENSDSETDGVQGRVRLEQVTYRQSYREKIWSPPGSIDEAHSRQVCTSVHVASGNCMSYRTETYDVPRHVEGAWLEKTRERDVPAVRVRAGIPSAAAPLAFTVKPGQIVLAARAIVANADVDYHGPDRCEDINATTRDCLLRRFTVHLSPAPMKAARVLVGINSTPLTPAQKALLARLEPMQVQVVGRAGTPDPLLGTPVSLRKPVDGSAGAK